MLKKTSSDPQVVHVAANSSKPALASQVRLGILVWVLLHVALLVHRGRNLTKSSVDFMYLAYEPMVPMVGMLWLWGLNIQSFTKAGIKYDALFEQEDQVYLLQGSQLFEIAAVITAMLSASAAYCANALAAGEYRVAAAMPVLLYGGCAVVVLLPVNILHHNSRLFFSKTLKRVFFPLATVTFSDFILGDILTSLAKALSDSELALCFLTSQDLVMTLAQGTFPDGHAFCGRNSWHVNLVLALPYLIRLCQCISVYKAVGDKSQLFNAGKYSTAIPVIVLSYAQYHSVEISWIQLWILASIIQTVYCVYWDIEKDWDISWFSQYWCGLGCLKLPMLKPDLLFPRQFYYWAISSNIVARALWIYKLSLHLKFNKTLHFLVSCVEVIRRYQWIFIRFESGLRKKNSRHHENGSDA